MENLLTSLEVNDVASCVEPGCREPRAPTTLHRGTRRCVRHLILALEGEKTVLLDSLRREEAARRAAEQRNGEIRVRLRDFQRVIDRDAFVSSLVRERDEAERRTALVRADLERRITELEMKVGRAVGT